MKIKTRRYYIYYFSRILFFLLRFIPLKVSLVIADALGRMAFNFLDKYREIAVSNLDEVFSKDHEQNVRIAKGVFSNLAKSGAEWIKIPSLNKKNIDDLVTEIEGIDRLEEALARGKGVIIMASHFGNWELLLSCLTLKGYTGVVIAKRLYFYKYDEFISDMRNKTGVRILYRDESPKKALKVLKEGGMLGVLADQDVDSVEGVFVDFFGKQAYTPVGPVKLGLVTGASIVPSFMIRKGDNTFKLVLEEPIVLSRGENTEDDIKRYTQEWTDVLEKYVRQYPEQWVWLHQRWKTKKS